MPTFSPLIDRALVVSATAHRNQVRKGSQVPYVIHPVHVALLLIRHQFPDEVIIAALLHDVGKIGLPDELLTKPVSHMSGDELGLLRKHPVSGQSALMGLENLRQAGTFVRVACPARGTSCGPRGACSSPARSPSASPWRPPPCSPACASATPDAPAGHTHWGTIGAIVAALMVGTGVLMASLAFSFQRYFEYQIEEARKISQ